MVTWHGNIFHITGPLWLESTDHWWIPLKYRASGMEFFMFFSSCYPEQAVKQTAKMQMFFRCITVMKTGQHFGDNTFRYTFLRNENALQSGKSGEGFAGDSFKYLLVREFFCILSLISNCSSALHASPSYTMILNFKKNHMLPTMSEMKY